MTYTYKNITGDTAEILLSYSDIKEHPISAMNLCNVHASDNVRIDLYLYRKYNSSGPWQVDHYETQTTSARTSTYYMIKNLIIPYGSTVQLESSDFLIDYKGLNYDLYIKLNTADGAVDVIIKN